MRESRNRCQREKGEIMARLKELYDKKIKSELATKLGIKNQMSIPKFSKVVINVGVGRAVADSKKLEEVEVAVTKITGQHPVRTKAKKSIAGFKIRDGMAIGCMVTLRGEKMYEFIDRLINASLPRVRDFRGINPDAFDGQGNYSLGIKEHTVFPELIGQDDVPISLQVNIETTAKNNDEARELLAAFGFPFRSK
jgi:large subunit ribosomal protein L5